MVASFPTVASVNSARVIVIAVDGSIGAISGFGVAKIFRAHIVIVARILGAWVTTPGDGDVIASAFFVAEVIRAWVVVVAVDRGINAS